MEERPKHYSKEDLAVFEKIILEKLAICKRELGLIKEAMDRQKHSGNDNSVSSGKALWDRADNPERKRLSEELKLLQQLENALIRVKIGTYGLCLATGKLIPKKRLLANPIYDSWDC